MVSTMTDNMERPDHCQACDEYYEYVDGLCWQCWHDAHELLRRENAEAEAEFKADQAQWAKECRNG